MNRGVGVLRISGILLLLLFEQVLSASFSGIVKDKNSGNPLENILVWINNYPGMTRSNAQGQFELENSTPIISSPKPHPGKDYIIWDGMHNRIFLPGSCRPNSMTIYTLQGKCLKNFIIHEGTNRTFSIPRLSVGFYIIRLIFPDYVVNHKLLHLDRQQRIFIPTKLSVKKPPMARVDSLFQLVFMHDDYLAQRVVVHNGNTNMLVFLKYDASSYIFADTKFHTYDITLSSANWQWLDENWEKEEYVSCYFKHNGIDYGEVGIRYKGSTSLAECFDENGNKINPKISMKVKFNKYNPDTRFYKVKRLNFHALNRDPTYMHERMGYALFREMGIYAPRAAHCRLNINGKYHGLFAVVEQIDGRFTDNRMSEDGDGNLYKQAWPCSEHKTYYDSPEVLKTNTDTINVTKMVAFAEAVPQINNANFASEIGKWTDPHYFMRYIAVDRGIVNWDGIMTWYTNKEWVGNHNYYWYEQQNQDGQFWLIPWDLDNVLERTDAIFEQAGVPRWYEGKNDTTLYPTAFGNGLFIRPPARDHLINLFAENAWQWYQYYGKVFLKDSFTYSGLENKLHRWIMQIDQAVKEEPYGQGYARWNRHAKALVADISFYRNNFKHLMDTASLHFPPADQTPYSNFLGLLSNQNNNFELTYPNTEIPQLFAYTNQNSSASFSRNYSAPLSGKSDLCFKVTFRNEPGAWSEWAIIGLPFFGGNTNISGYQYLLIDFRCASDRSIRVDLGSNAYSNPDGPQYGWYTKANSKASTAVLPLYKVAYPSWEVQEPILDQVLSSVTYIRISPTPHWKQNGMELVNDPDVCTVHIDNIRFIK